MSCCWSSSEELERVPHPPQPVNGRSACGRVSDPRLAFLPLCNLACGLAGTGGVAEGSTKERTDYAVVCEEEKQ